MDEARLAELSGILFFITGAFIFVLGGLITAKFIRPSRPNEEKNTIYESGEESQGSAWTNFNVRFYIIALVFVLFEVEMVFLFPWATIYFYFYIGTRLSLCLEKRFFGLGKTHRAKKRF